MASADYRVLLPERVSLEYDIAGVGSRGAAAMIDLGLQLVALTVVLVGGGAALASAGAAGLNRFDRGTGIALLAVLALAVFAVTNGYFILFEIVWNGQTPGKRLVGVRVIREDGYPLRPLDAVIRNLVRIVDWLPFGYAVGVAAMLLNDRARRLGDFASGTLVVREARYASATAADPASPSTAPPPVGTRIALANADATLVRDFLLRRTGLRADARARLARGLADLLARRYGLPAVEDPEPFLESLAG